MQICLLTVSNIGKSAGFLDGLKNTTNFSKKCLKQSISSSQKTKMTYSASIRFGTLFQTYIYTTKRKNDKTMKKREIIEQVNATNYWERTSTLLNMLVKDGRLPEHNCINTYSVDIAENISMIYYNRDAVVIVNFTPDTRHFDDFVIYCQDGNENDKANRRR